MADEVERSLIERAKAGDVDAYERLLEPSVRSATRLAFAMLRDRSEAEDAFQEASLRAWQRLTNLHEGKRFQPWFIGIVANQCREIRRGRWWSVARLPEPFRAPPLDEAAWLDGENLRRAIDRLPHKQRVVILMHFHLDMPLSDVADALALSTSGVKTRINRALKQLRPAVASSEVTVNG